MLGSSMVFIPKAYAENIEVATDSTDSVNSPNKWIEDYRQADRLIASIEAGINTDQTAKENGSLIESINSEETTDLPQGVTENVYSADQNINFIDKVIDYPANYSADKMFPTSAKQGQPADGVFMRHVIHMPDIIDEPEPYTPIDKRDFSEQDPVINQTVTNDVYPAYSIIKSDGFADVSISSEDNLTLPKSLLINDINSGIEINDLILINTDSEENFDREESILNDSVSSDVYDDYNEENTYMVDKNSKSVVSGVYNTTGNSFPIKNKGGKFDIGFSRQTGNNILQFTYQEADLTLGLDDVKSVSGEVYKNSIVYEEIYPEIDLKYTVESSRIKEELIVKSYTGQNEFSFQLSVNNAVYQVMDDSTIMFSNPDSEQPLFFIPKSFAVDNEGNRCDNISMEFTKDGLLIVTVDPDWLEEAIYPVIIDPTISLFDATFSRSSIAYKQDGTQVTSGSPRYEAGKFNQGIMIEEGTTNLLTSNQASVEGMLPGGYVGDGSTVARSTQKARIGTASIKVVTGTGLWDGIDLWNGNDGTGFPVTPGQTYTFSYYALGAVGGERITISAYRTDWTHLASGTSVTLSSTEWTRTAVTFTVPSGCTSLFFMARKATDAAVRTWYIDCLQLEQRSYVTSWIEGGITRAAETLTIPTTGVFQKGNWTVELTYKPTSTPTNSPMLFCCVINENNNYQLQLNSSGCLGAYVRSGGIFYSILDTSPLAVGQTYSIMFTGNGTHIQLFINGVQIGTSKNYVEAVGSLPANMLIGSWYTGSFYANGIIDDLRVSNRARTAAEAQAAYQSNQPLPLDAYTTCKLSFDSTLHANPTVNIINSTFTRASLAYKQDGTQVANGTPRYETAKFNQGIMIEEGTTNLLTSDQASIEGVLPGGYMGDGAIVARSTVKARKGTASIKVVTGTGLWDGIDLWNGNDGTGFPVTPGQTYTFSYYALGAVGGERITICAYKNDWTALASGPGITLSSTTWTRNSLTFTVPAGCTSVFFTARKNTDGPVRTWYMDCLQLEQKSYVTSWIDGGSTRAFETLTIQTSGVFTKGNWTIETNYIPVDNQATGGWTSLWNLTIDNNNNYSLSIQPNGKLYLAVRSNGIEVNTASASNSPALSVGTQYAIMASGNGSVIRLFVNGIQIGPDYTYTEPVGQLPTYMYIGSYSWGAQQGSGIYDNLRISNRARTLTEHQAAYQSNQPLPLDAFTTCKFSFDGGTSGYSTARFGPGMESYWNYTSMSLGGGWSASVNTWNQNLILTKPLFSIPGRGLAIGESITYNSISKTWTLGNNTSLIENSDGSVTYNKWDGGAYTFTPNGSGGYTAPAGVYLTLQKNGTGNFTILDKYKNTYNYLNGKPNQFKDRNNNTTTFTYNSGRLYQVSDPSGRKLTYTYDPTSGNIVSITDPANHIYRFGYQNGNLTTVTDPDNKTFTLAYDANGHVSSFTDPLNRVTSFYSDPNGQLQRLRDARTTGQDVYETSFTQDLQGNSILTMMTDPGNKTTTFYHNSETGNLTKYQDALGHTWQYVWTSNNLMQSQDVKGTTSYQYDSRGNITRRTTTVDSNPNNNIIETMTYDDYSQLLREVDGSGRVISYQYSNKGELLSTADPDLKESNGRKYDQYGNAVEYSPAVSGNHNLLRNGSMEIPGTGGNLLANWTRSSGAATVSLEGFNSHGNSALKISSNTPTTDWFYQSVDNNVGSDDNLTLRADMKLENVQPSGGEGGAIIRLKYENGAWDSWYCWGSGTVPLILTSNSSKKATVHVGLWNASGTVWIDGVQLENEFYPKRRYNLSSFNSVENSGFEQNLEKWSYTGATPTVTYEGDAWGGKYSLKIQGAGTIYQDVPVYPGEPLTFSGMVRTDSVTGNGAYYKVDYYNAANSLISGATVQTGYVTGTQDFTRLTGLAEAPAGAHHARVQGILDGNGTVYFDAVKLIPRNSNKYIYDAASGNYAGRNYIITSEDALEKQNKYTYDANTGNELSYTNGRNRTTSYGYDNLNRLVWVSDPLLRSAYYGYDAVDNCISTRDPRSASPTDNTYLTGYGPNDLNRLGTLTDPLSRSYAYIYDRSGNLTDILLPNGQTEHFDYDKANRLIKTTYGNGKYFAYTYDDANNLIRVVDQDNNSYSGNYDGVHRLTSSTDALGYGLTYQWDKSHNLTALSGSDYNCQYNFGSDNRLLTVTLPDGPIIFYDYDENGQIFQVRYLGSYDYRKYNYLSNGWCEMIQDPCFPGQYNYNYYYNDDGTISGYSSWAGWDSFSYDANGRLTYWNYSPMSGTSIYENYSYDHAGNLLTKGNKTFSYNSANQITSSGFTYDNNGNMTGDGTYIYSYNARNQLIQVKKTSDNSLVADYKYNYDGLRKSKTVYVGQNTGTTSYNWDASGNLVRESTPSGVICYYYDTAGDLIGLKKNNQTYFVHNNLRGDIVSITDTYGNIVSQYHFDPWGKQISYSGSLIQPFRYASYYYDDETGLYYLKSRYYSPTLGRFLTKDSTKYIKLIDPQTLNLYTYSNNNPINFVDPDGNDTTSKLVKAQVFVITTLKLANNAFKTAVKKLINKGAGKVLSPSEAANKIVNAERVGSGLKGDTYHRAASYLSESQISKGTVYDLGKNNTLLQVEGSVNGKTGIFEYILNKNGQVTHQLFKEGGVINGIPN